MQWIIVFVLISFGVLFCTLFLVCILYETFARHKYPLHVTFCRSMALMLARRVIALSLHFLRGVDKHMLNGGNNKMNRYK